MRKTSKKIYYKLVIPTIGALIILIFIGFSGKIDQTNQNTDFQIHTNNIDLSFRPLSDSAITHNAIVKDARFGDLSFLPVKERQLGWFGNQFANVYRTLTKIKAPEDRAREVGSWLWTPTLQLTPEYIDTMLSGAQEHGINVIYLSIDSYLDIYVLPEGAQKEKALAKFSEILRYFITKANTLGIAVDAEAGWRNWAEPGHTYKPLAIVEFVKKFNSENSTQFRGIQYDIEPYLLDEYYENEAKVLKNFVTLVDQTVETLAGSGLSFGVVIPDFYDEKDGFTARFEYMGEIESTFKHLLTILERHEDASIILMSYRNRALGEDGSIDVSQNEIFTVDEDFYRTKVIIAQETGDFEPPYITFHNTSRSSLKSEVAILEDSFRSFPNYGGVAYHYLNSFLALK